jgi:hypothetical protein
MFICCVTLQHGKLPIGCHEKHCAPICRLTGVVGGVCSCEAASLTRRAAAQAPGSAPTRCWHAWPPAAANPTATFMVTMGDVKAFLGELPVEELPGRCGQVLQGGCHL